MAHAPKTKTKIIATVGPATQSREMLAALIEAGVDVFRLNMGHMDHEAATEVIARIRRLSSRASVLVDLQGPKIRLTKVTTPFEVSTGARLEFATGTELSSPEVLHVPFAELVPTLEMGHRILVDDGLVRMRVVERLGTDRVLVEVDEGGLIKSNKGVVAPDTRITPEDYLDAQDRADCAFAAKRRVDFVAASFVSRPDDIAAVRQALGDQAEDIDIIAKIESRVGVENFDAIVASADGVMIARGDLGVELPPEEVPLVQKRLVGTCNAARKPVIVATQMLESMVQNPVASRAETSDVANAILDGTDAVMLSAETSVGRHPVAAVRTLTRISTFVEREARLFRDDLFHQPSSSRVEFVCKAAARVAEELHLTAIVSLTSSGFTARNMSAFRPRVPIFATTPNDQVIRRLSLQYGVHAIHSEHIGRYDVMLYKSLNALIAHGLLTSEDTVAVIGGVPVGKPGSTNLLQVGTVAELMDMD